MVTDRYNDNFNPEGLIMILFFSYYYANVFSEFEGSNKSFWFPGKEYEYQNFQSDMY